MRKIFSHWRLEPVEKKTYIITAENGSLYCFISKCTYCSEKMLCHSTKMYKFVSSHLAFFINLQRVVIGPSATLTGRLRPAINSCRMLTGFLFQECLYFLKNYKSLSFTGIASWQVPIIYSPYTSNKFNGYHIIKTTITGKSFWNKTDVSVMFSNIQSSSGSRL